MQAPKITLNNGQQMPAVGFGTYKVGGKAVFGKAAQGVKPEDVPVAIRAAIESGYRHIDCALLYNNEPAVGKAIAQCLKDGLVRREELWITSKLWNTFHRPDLVKAGVEKSLKDLQLDYLDLYLMHTPMDYQAKEQSELMPMDKDGHVVEAGVDFLDTWRAMEELITEGKVRSIGVSNFNKEQVERLLKEAKVPPAVNQVECHPFLTNEELVEFCTSHGVNVTAYNIFSVAGRTDPDPTSPSSLHDQLIDRIAKKHNKTRANVIIRWLLQRGLSVLVKSKRPERISSNFKVFDFDLTPAEMNEMRSLECGFRAVVYTEAQEHSHYPFREMLTSH